MRLCPVFIFFYTPTMGYHVMFADNQHQGKVPELGEKFCFTVRTVVPAIIT